MSRLILDTNTLSYLLRGHEAVTRKVTSMPMAALCISSISEGELLFGLAKRPQAGRLHRLVHELLLRVEVLPWDRAAANTYGSLRARMESKGQVLAPLDLLIAAHAYSIGATLVTSDQAFLQVPDLVVEDWTH